MADFWKVKVRITIDKSNWDDNISATGFATFMMSKIDGAIYKPVDIILDKGSRMSGVNISGKNSNRIDEKIQIIDKFCINSHGLKLKKDVAIGSELGIDGYVGIFSALSGSNQNRSFPCLVKSEHDILNGIKLAQYIQDPKKYSGALDINSFEEINIDDLFLIEYEQLSRLAEHQFYNIKTCSIGRSERILFASNKNGQKKSDKEIMDMISRAEGINMENRITAFFRKKVKDRFNQKCALCGVSVDTIMVASHIKAKHESSDIKEKIDDKNGLWLCAGHDKLFDRRLISFDNDGKIMISKTIEKFKKQLYIDSEMKIGKKYFDESKEYIKHHRNIFTDKNK